MIEGIDEDKLYEALDQLNDFRTYRLWLNAMTAEGAPLEAVEVPFEVSRIIVTEKHKGDEEGFKLDWFDFRYGETLN